MDDPIHRYHFVQKFGARCVARQIGATFLSTWSAIPNVSRRRPCCWQIRGSNPDELTIQIRANIGNDNERAIHRYVGREIWIMSCWKQHTSWLSRRMIYDYLAYNKNRKNNLWDNFESKGSWYETKRACRIFFSLGNILINHPAEFITSVVHIVVHLHVYSFVYKKYEGHYWISATGHIPSLSRRLLLPKRFRSPDTLEEYLVARKESEEPMLYTSAWYTSWTR